MLLSRQLRPRRAVLALVAAGLAVAAATAGPAAASPTVTPGAELTESAAAALVPVVRDAAGPALAGVWFVPEARSPGTGRLMAGTWEPALAPVLSALGATPVVRSGPPRDPDAALRTLAARTEDGVPGQIADFGVDEPTRTLVVTVVEGSTESAGVRDLLRGLDPAAVRVVTTSAAPRLQAAIGGGDTITDGRSRCTVGFTATDGAADWLVTAGHCTRDASTWYSGPEGAVVSDDARSAEGGPDAGAIRVGPGWEAVPTAGGQPVRGMRVAPVGTTVCLNGSTSGRICGPVTRQDVVVNFGGQQQSGLTAADLCAQMGDSGGPYTTPDGQAQGIHTGAGGPGCTSYFTPVGSAMGALGLTMRTG